jgi:tRNA A37 methylthiotransferase MiaB
MSDNGRTVYVCVRGCIHARVNSARVEDFFRANGWRSVSDPADAGLIVLYACGSHHTQATESTEFIQWISSEHPGKELLVWGCLPVVDPVALGQVYGGKSFGPREISRFDAYGDRISIEAIEANRLVGNLARQARPSGSSAHRLYSEFSRLCSDLVAGLGRLAGNAPYPAGTSENAWLLLCCKCMGKAGRIAHRLVIERKRCFYITCATGCLGTCRYCSIRKARGRLSSKPLAKIRDEFERGLRAGYSSFRLVATDLGCYGFDLGTNLVALLKQLGSGQDDYQLWLEHVNPKHLRRFADDLDPGLMSHVSIIGVPPESGSDRILERMDRGYSAAEYRGLVQQLRALAPKAAITAGFVVGFPGETERDFKLSRRLLATTTVDLARALPFSPRPGVAARTMPGMVGERTMLRRWAMLQADCSRRAALYAARCVLGTRHRLFSAGA